MASTPPPALEVTHEDDPRVIREQRSEDYTTHVVPLTARVGKLKLNMATWSLLSALNWVFYGALVASLVGTRQALLGIVLAAAVYAIINVFMAGYGTRFGLNSFLLSRRMFGVLGASLTPLLIAANTTYFTVFESSVLAVAFKSYFGVLDIRIWYLIVIVAILPLMLGSVQTWMDKINAYLLPVYVVGIIAAVIMAGIQNTGSSGWFEFQGVLQDQTVPGWLQAFALYMGVWLLMPVTVDFARLGRPRDLPFHRHVTFGWVFYLWLFLVNGLAGIYLVQTVLPTTPAAETGVVDAIVRTLGIFGVLLLIATQTRINTMNFYLASSNWERFFVRVFKLQVPRVFWVGIVAIVAFVLMLTNVFSYLQQALLWQGVFLVSWVGIVLTHFALTPDERKAGPEFRPGRIKRFSPGLIVWIVSAGIGIILAVNPATFPVLSPVAPLVALALSVALYALVLKALPSTMLNRILDPRNEVDDAWSARIRCHRCERSYVAVEMDRDPSAGERAICNTCADSSHAFLHAVSLDGRGVQPPATTGSPSA